MVVGSSPTRPTSPMSTPTHPPRRALPPTLVRCSSVASSRPPAACLLPPPPQVLLIRPRRRSLTWLAGRPTTSPNFEQSASQAARSGPMTGQRSSSAEVVIEYTRRPAASRPAAAQADRHGPDPGPRRLDGSRSGWLVSGGGPDGGSDWAVDAVGVQLRMQKLTSAGAGALGWATPVRLCACSGVRDVRAGRRADGRPGRHSGWGEHLKWSFA